MPITLNGTTGISGVNGSAGTPALQGTDTNTGIFFGTDEVSIATGGSNRLIVDSSGRVGLGTSSPSTLLEIKQDQDANTRLRITNASDTASATAGIHLAPYGGNWYIEALRSATFANPLRFTFDGTERFRFTYDGRLGIGTTTPDSNSKLDVSGGAINLSDGNILAWGGGSSRTYIEGSKSAGTLTFVSAGTEAFRLDSSRRLLVGTSTARATFGSSAAPQIQSEGTTTATGSIAVIKNNASDGGNIFLANTGGSTVGSTTATASSSELGAVSFNGFDGSNFKEGATIRAVNDQASAWASGDCPTRLVFSTTADGASSPTERMRITNVGIVNIGTSGSTLAPSTTSTGITLYPNDYSVFSSAGNEPITVNRNNDGAIVSCRRSGTNVGSISVTTTATAFNTSSDYRLKENVVPLTGAANRLRQIPVHRFNFIAEPDKTVDGFLAHEAQAIVPECVTGTKDEVDADGNPVYQGIDQSKLVPLLTAALQEALQKIETLEAKVAALEAQ